MNEEISTKDCVGYLNEAESVIEAYASSLKGDTDHYLRVNTIKEYGVDCTKSVITILKFISGES